MATKAQIAERDAAIEELRAMLKPGDTVHTILRHVSSSGMMRHIDVMQLSAEQGGRMEVHERWLSYLVAKALGYKLSDSRGSRDAILVGGAGMDMGYHLVHNLGYALFPNGYGCIGEGCPSSDHSNGDRDYTPHTCTEGHFPEQHLSAKPGTPGCHWHRSGGYALRQRWL